MCRKVILVCGCPPLRSTANYESAISAPLIDALSEDARGGEYILLVPEDRKNRGHTEKNLIKSTKTSFRVISIQPQANRLNPLQFLKIALRRWPPSAIRTYLRWNKPVLRELSKLYSESPNAVIHLLSPTAAIMAHGWKKCAVCYSGIDSFKLAISNGGLGRADGLLEVLKRKLILKLEGDLASDRAALVYVSSRDSDCAASRFKSEVLTIPIGCDTSRFTVSAQYTSSNQELIFVGSPTYKPNEEALLILLGEIVPIVWRSIPNLRIRIVGRGTKEFAAKMGYAREHRIRAEGFIEDLGKSLAKATVAAYPLKSGSGMKNKVLDSLACGLPVVAYPEALSGHNGLPGAITCENPTTFAASIIKVLESEEIWTLLSKAGRIEANQRSWSTIAKQYSDLWGRIGAGLEN
jgi:glycosyltransferase involved in cell wall biosynthesis